MKKCTRCGIEKSLSEFNFKDKSLKKHTSSCKTCTRLLIKNHYNENREYYLNKTHKRNKALRQALISHTVDYLRKNPCVDCGEDDIAVLDFDHKDLSTKSDSISAILRNRSSVDSLVKEIEKCEVRCANCHRRRTSKQFNWLKICTRSEMDITSAFEAFIGGSSPSGRTDEK